MLGKLLYVTKFKEVRNCKSPVVKSGVSISALG